MEAASQQGITVTVEQLRRLRVEALRLAGSRGNAVNGLFPGAYQALFHGRGMEFDEVRAYQQGDDYRVLDWRVTARTGQLHTKLFQQERERTLFLLLNAGDSMHFGTRVQFKWVLAARVAAVYTWLAVASGDRIAGVVYGHQSAPSVCPPFGGETGALRLFKQLSDVRRPVTGQTSTLAEGLQVLRTLIKPGALVLLLGDFNDLEDRSEKLLAHIGNHHDVAGVQLHDPLEKNLPPPGIYAITDGKQRQLLDSRPEGIRAAFAERFEEQRVMQRSVFHRCGARVISLATDRPLLESLAAALQGSSNNR